MTTTRALCNECGNIRTISRRYRGGKYVGEPGPSQDDPWWGNTRMMQTLKCSACGRPTRHARLRDNDEHADIIELANHYGWNPVSEAEIILRVYGKA